MKHTVLPGPQLFFVAGSQTNFRSLCCRGLGDNSRVTLTHYLSLGRTCVCGDSTHTHNYPCWCVSSCDVRCLCYYFRPCHSTVFSGDVELHLQQPSIHMCLHLWVHVHLLAKERIHRFIDSCSPNYASNGKRSYSPQPCRNAAWHIVIPSSAGDGLDLAWLQAYLQI